MKKITVFRIALIALLLVSIVADCVSAVNRVHQYEVAMVVDEVTEECVVVVDNAGEAWEFEGDGYEVGQMIIVVFNDNGTISPYDDKIIEIRG